MPTVLHRGSRGGCGKTTTARRFTYREVLLDEDTSARGHAEHGTIPLGDGPYPLLIDEWQLAPQTWYRVRRASDDPSGTGRFILTGSANPTDDITRHSGAGRVARAPAAEHPTSMSVFRAALCCTALVPASASTSYRSYTLELLV